MKHVATATSVVGGQTPTHWNQTLLQHNIFVAVEIEEIAAAHVGKQFLLRIQDQWSKFPKNLASFKYFLDTCANSKSISFVAAAFSEATLYMVIKNRGQIWIKRKNRIGRILDASGTATGRIYPEDVLLLLSPSFTTLMSPTEITDLLHLTGADLISETLTLTLHGKNSRSSAAGVVLTFSEEKEAANFRKITRLAFISKSLHLLSRLKASLVAIKYVPGKMKPLGWVIVSLVIIFLVSVGWGIFKQKQTQQTTRISQSLELATHKYDEGIALVDLNPIRARSLLFEAKDLLTKSFSSDKTLDVKRQDLLTKTNQGMAFALRRYEIKPVSFFDLDLIKPQASGTQLALYQDALVVLDSKNKSLYKINISTKASKILAGGETFSHVSSVTLHADSVYVFDGNLMRISSDGKLIPVVNKDKEWGNIAQITAYAGNLYLLDTEKNQIWKYIATDSGFSARQDYLVFDTQLDLQNAHSLMIDGAAWVVTGNEIIKTIQGKDVSWKIQGLDETLGNQIDLYTDDTTKNIYVLDANHKRVVVVDKDGVYLAQYFWQEDMPISDFVVSEALKKILLLANGTIYGIELK